MNINQIGHIKLKSGQGSLVWGIETQKLAKESAPAHAALRPTRRSSYTTEKYMQKA